MKNLLKAKYAAQEAILKGAIDAGRGMNAEELTKYDALKTEIEGLEATIEAQAAIEARQAALKEPVNTPIYTKPAIVDKPFESFGEQLKAIVNAGMPGGQVDPRLFKNAASGANESVPSEGGFLVQKDFVSELLKRTYETSVLAPKCRKIPIGANANGLKINTIDETSRADGSRWGGVRGYWANEADTVTGSKPKFGQIDMSLEKLMGICYATDELLEDTSAMEAVVMDGFAEEFGFKVDDGIFNGTGAGQLLGLMNSGALVTVAKEANQAATTIVFQNIMKMWSRMYARSRANSAWFINQDIEPQLFGMSMAVGAAGVPVYMPANGISASPYGTLFGRPVIPVEQAATLGTTGDIVLADLSQYLLIDKGSMKGDQSIHVRFIYGENTFRFTYRVNGQPIWKSPLTPFKGTNTQSPFVALATRA